MRQFI